MSYRVELYCHASESKIKHLFESEQPPTEEQVKLWIEQEFEDPLELSIIDIASIPFKEELKMAVREPEEQYDTVELKRLKTNSVLSLNFSTPQSYSSIMRKYPGWHIVDGHKVK